MMPKKANLLDMAAAAEYVGVDYRTFREYVRRGYIASVQYPSLSKRRPGRPRRTRFFRIETLDQFIANNERTEGQQVVEIGNKVGNVDIAKRYKPYPDDWRERLHSGRLK